MYHAQVTSVVPANLGTFTVPAAALAYLPPSGTWQIEITAAVNQGGVARAESGTSTAPTPSLAVRRASQFRRVHGLHREHRDRQVQRSTAPLRSRLFRTARAITTVQCRLMSRGRKRRLWLDSACPSRAPKPLMPQLLRQSPVPGRELHRRAVQVRPEFPRPIRHEARA